MVGKIAGIKRFAVHDGPGIRTTVFMKGCPLRCVWCHNPETISPEPELGYIAKKCAGCGECVSVCPKGLHRMEEGKHIFSRGGCIGCGQCASVCLGNALFLYGSMKTAAEVFDMILEDRGFYDETGGGVTISGGEPFLQPAFCTELLELAKNENIHTAVDTCGAVSWKAFEEALPVTDLFLYDIKQMDSALHKRYTGIGNEMILDNLRHLSKSGASIEIRIPLVPGCNDDERNIIAIGQFLRGLSGIRAVRVLPYNDLARSKYASIGNPDTLPDTAPPSDESLHAVATCLRSFNLNAFSGKD